MEKTERENVSAALRRAGRAQRKPCGGSVGKEGKGKRERSTSQSRPPAAEHGAESMVSAAISKIERERERERERINSH